MAERLCFGRTDRQEFRKSDRGVSSQELAVSELLVEDQARSGLQQWQELHPASEDGCAAAESGEEWEVRGELRPLSVRCGVEAPAAS